MNLQIECIVGGEQVECKALEFSPNTSKAAEFIRLFFRRHPEGHLVIKNTEKVRDSESTVKTR